MGFSPKPTRQKEKAGYKTLYLSQKLIDEIGGLSDALAYIDKLCK